MSGFQDVYIAVEPVNLKKLIALVETGLSGGWKRDSDAEERYAKEVPNYTMFCFSCADEGLRKAARLWMPYRADILEVSNIVPSETSELSHAQYNLILEDFYAGHLKPACANLGLKHFIGFKSKSPRWAVRKAGADEARTAVELSDDRNGWSVKEQLTDTQVSKPHVLILGAGASVAAFPNGDKFGRRLPVMKDFIKVLELQPILKKHDISNISG